MDKLSQVTIENSLNLVVSYQVDQSLLARNFVTIVNALKDLKDAQNLSDSKIKDLSSLADKYKQLSEKIQKIQKGGSHTSKQTSNTSNDGQQNMQNMLSALTKRVDKNETSILDSIKDINLLNKDVSEVKNDIQDLKKRLSNHKDNVGKGDQGNNKGYNINDVAENLNKQLSKSEQTIKALANRLTTAEQNIDKLQKQVSHLQKSKSHNQGQKTDNSSFSDKQLQDIKKDLRDKLDVINKKINNLQSDSSQHERDIAYIKQALEEKGTNNGQKEGQQNNSKNDQSSKFDISSLKKRIEEVNEKEKKDVRALQQEINNLKIQLKGLLSKPEKAESKTSLQDQNNKSNRKTLSKDRDQLSEKLNDLILKVNYLQKLIAGSKNSLSDQRNSEKLPNIGIGRPRKANMTMYQDKQKEKSGIGRRDLAELKAELQAWLKSIIDQHQSRQNLQGLQLKLQQIRRNLQRKADAQGTKKGFSFLQNKITQLYLFLTEPETEDAMIVRKGFNCLSCSKKVEKLRGKLGPHLNWNNMTSTNYSPPRVGYSKPMGQNSMEKEDDL